MVRILREADSRPVKDVARENKVSEQTIYSWCKRLGDLEAVDVGRLRDIERENHRLKRLLAERDLEIDVLKEISQGKF